ncbi:hypothetical protein B0H14DRAFT_3897750 [Mycena olivaceomarginata]|nr:hypothetical protein B0H14DRAFT_3897750 [Mycena olivaceomarginata]
MTADDVKIVFGNIGELAMSLRGPRTYYRSALDDPDATDDHIGELVLTVLAAGNITLTTSDAAIRLETSLACSATVRSSNDRITGTYAVDDSLDIQTSNGYINVVASITNETDSNKTKDITLRTSNSLLDYTINLGPTAGEVGTFRVETETSNAKLTGRIASAPLNSAIMGIFELSTSNAGIFIDHLDPKERDPACGAGERCKERNRSLLIRTSASGGAAGSIFWAKKNTVESGYNQRGEYSYRDSSNSGGGNTRDYSTSRNNRDSSGASMHTNTSSTSSGKAAHVSNVLAALDPGLGSRRAPAHSNSMSSGYTSTSGGYGAASSSYATSMTSGSPPPPTISGPFSLGSITGKPKGASDGYSGTGRRPRMRRRRIRIRLARAQRHIRRVGSGRVATGAAVPTGVGSGLSRSGSRNGNASVLANRNGNGASKFDLSKVDPNTFPMGDTGTVRRSHSPTPTTTTTRTVKDGQEEFGEVVLR